jgi:hypothetical protein
VGSSGDIIFSDVIMLRRYGHWNGFVRYSDGGTGEGKGSRIKDQGARFKVKGERSKDKKLPPPAPASGGQKDRLKTEGSRIKGIG